mgnify:CR=1 FL=1
MLEFLATARRRFGCRRSGGGAGSGPGGEEFAVRLDGRPLTRERLPSTSWRARIAGASPSGTPTIRRYQTIGHLPPSEPSRGSWRRQRPDPILKRRGGKPSYGRHDAHPCRSSLGHPSSGCRLTPTVRPRCGIPGSASAARPARGGGGNVRCACGSSGGSACGGGGGRRQKEGARGEETPGGGR